MSIDLRGKSICITGASSGIGEATAIACAKAGMNVAVGARRVDRLRSLVERFQAMGVKAIALPCDVRDASQCTALVEASISSFGDLYAVYANAGYGYERRVQDTPEADIRDIFETNFWGSLNIIRPALPHMLAARRGHILMCSSCLSKIGIPYMCAYSATKAAQDHFGRGMRAELRGTGVYVSTVHPVRTTTELFDEVARRSGGSRIYTRGTEMFVQSANVVADATVRCLRRPRGEVWTSPAMRLALAVATAFPSLADWAVSRYGKTTSAAAQGGAH